MPGVKGRSGRRAKTVKQHRLEGTFQPSRHGGYTNADPPQGEPPKPEGLTGEASAEWDRMIADLAASKSLSVTDGRVLYQHCQNFADTEQLALRQAETGASVEILEENLSGLEGSELVQAFQEITKLRQLESRYVNQIRQGRLAVLRFLVECGNTPASRSRVKIPEKPAEVDPFDEFDVAKVH